MDNDWCWEKYDNSEYRLKNSYGHVVAYLICNYNDKWSCLFYNDDFDWKFKMTFEGFDNAEQIIQQATIWIYNTCNQIANSFHRIRDHLPKVYCEE